MQSVLKVCCFFLLVRLFCCCYCSLQTFCFCFQYPLEIFLISTDVVHCTEHCNPSGFHAPLLNVTPTYFRLGQGNFFPTTSSPLSSQSFISQEALLHMDVCNSVLLGSCTYSRRLQDVSNCIPKAWELLSVLSAKMAFWLSACSRCYLAAHQRDRFSQCSHGESLALMADHHCTLKAPT